MSGGECPTLGARRYLSLYDNGAIEVDRPLDWIGTRTLPMTEPITPDEEEEAAV